jgi:hypothetical protein
LTVLALLDAWGRITERPGAVRTMRVVFTGGFHATLPFPREVIRWF